MKNLMNFLSTKDRFFNENRLAYFAVEQTEPQKAGGRQSEAPQFKGSWDMLEDEQRIMEQAQQRADKMKFEVDFNKKIKALNGKIDLLRDMHVTMEKDKQRGGVMEALIGKMHRDALAKIQKYSKEVEIDLLALNQIAQRTNYQKGKQSLRYALDSLQTLDSIQHTTYWTMVGRQISTKQGLNESWDFFKAYSKGVGKGVISMLDPRTYYHLAQMLGEGTASLIYCKDNGEKIQRMIKNAGDAWDKADEKGKADMLGQFMGTIVGTKGLGVMTKAGKVAMLNKVKGTTLGMDVGQATAKVGTRLANAPVGKMAVRAVERTKDAGKAVGKGAEVAINAIRPAFARLNQSITYIRGKLASITDKELKAVLADIKEAEKAVAMAKQGKTFEATFGVKGGEMAVNAAKKAIPELYDSITATLKQRGIGAAVKNRLGQLRNATGRLGDYMGAGIKRAADATERAAVKVAQGAKKAGEAVGKGAEVAINALQPTFTKLNLAITKIRGRIASLTDAELRNTIAQISEAEKVVGLVKKTEMINIKGGQMAVDAARRALPGLYEEVSAALKQKGIGAAVKNRLGQLRNATARLNKSIVGPGNLAGPAIGMTAGQRVGAMPSLMSVAHADSMQRKAEAPSKKTSEKTISAAPVKPEKTEAPQNITYTVKKGDNLWRIALSQYGNGRLYNELMKVNKLDSDVLQMGQKLTLPPELPNKIKRLPRTKK